MVLTMYYRSICTSISERLRDIETDRDIGGANLNELKAIIDQNKGQQITGNYTGQGTAEANRNTEG